MTNPHALTAPREIPKHLTFDEVRRLIDACEQIPSFQKYKVADRNRLLLETLWQTGCRLGEVIGGKMVRRGKVTGSYTGIRPCDLDVRAGTIYIQVEKRHTPYSHNVSVEPALINELTRLAYEQEIPKDERIFQVSKRQVQVMIKLAAEQAGIVQKVTPHILRHSHAMHLRRLGVHPFVMKQALGHVSIESTLVYGQATDEDVAQAKSKIQWR
jgi:integrase/recombinase XerD